MSKELEEMAEATTAKKREKWVPKPLTAEEIEKAKKACAKLAEFGFTEKTMAVINAAPDWKNEDATIKEENRKSLNAALEDPKAFMNSEEFAADLELIEGLHIVTGIVKTIHTNYTRQTYKPKAKMRKVSIEGVIYLVNDEYAQSLANDPDRRAKILQHPDTKKFEAEIEEF